jgi:hypothetical protein
MSARLAELCRENYLTLKEEELNQKVKGEDPIPAHLCQNDIFIGVFFDGTNNNKFRDLQGTSACNNARLFEAFLGKPAKHKATYGGKDHVARLDGIPASAQNFYRKIYIPGLGTSFPEVNDKGVGIFDKTLGLAAANNGEERIRWAMIQVLNQLSLSLSGDNTPVATNEKISEEALREEDRQTFGEKGWLKSHPERRYYDYLFAIDDFSETLEKSLKSNSLITGNHIRRVRLSVFGFSRGAAAARAFVNRFIKVYGNKIAGLNYTIDFLGIFDTVASVGVAALGEGLGAEGHFAWAEGTKMVIPPQVKRCVHLVAAHEVRRSFPLDSVAKDENLPENCKEIVYPGVHSDVGGGYPVMDQGRCDSDSNKISQITLAQMYREALMAGVPLATEKQMPPDVRELFQISPKIIASFNAYIESTQYKGVGVQDNMHLTETQVPQSLRDIMFKQHWCYILWRKYRLGPLNSEAPGAPAGPLTVYQLPGLVNSKEPNAKQDIFDIWQTNETLKFEANNVLRKFENKAHMIFSALYQSHVGLRSREYSITISVADVLVYSIWREKELDPSVQEYVEIIRLVGGKMPFLTPAISAHADIIKFFDDYVHDSRAWFKLPGTADDEWFGSGNDPDGVPRKSMKDAYRAKLEAKREKALTEDDRKARDRLTRYRKNPENFDSAYRTIQLTEDEKRWKAIDKKFPELAFYERIGDTLLQKPDGDVPWFGLGNNVTSIMDPHESTEMGAGYLPDRIVYYTSDLKRGEKLAMTPYEIQMASKQTAAAIAKVDTPIRNKMFDLQNKTLIPWLLDMQKNLDTISANGDPKDIAQCLTAVNSALCLMGDRKTQNANVQERAAKLRATIANMVEQMKDAEAEAQEFPVL